MKISNKAIIVTLALSIIAATPVFAIEGLKLQIRCPDVVLSWPSTNDETYLVQYRETLSTNTPWETLTNSIAAETGTNITTFTHSNRVDCPIGQVFGMMMESSVGIGMSTLASTLTIEERNQLKQAREEARLAALYEKCKLEGREPYDWELKNQPPLPLSAEEVRARILKARANGAATLSSASVEGLNLDGPSGVGGANGPVPAGDGVTPSTGFYRVVRNGLHFFGLTNNTVLSGAVTLPIEIGFAEANSVDGLFVSIAGTDPEITEPAAGLEIYDDMAGDGARAVWDTRFVTNGMYQLYAGCTVNEGGSYESQPVSVIVSNQIWFPDPMNVAGYYINIQAQTIYTNGAYHVDMYDQANNLILALDGTTDAEGFILYNGQRGFLVENFDANGDQYPDTHYPVAFQTGPGGGGGTPTNANTTNIIFTEFAWPAGNSGWTKFAIAYQPIFGNPSAGGLNAVALQGMIQAVYGSAEARPGFPQGYRVIRGGSQYPNELWGQGDFTQMLVPDLRDDFVRNFYYFGHGATKFIGQKNVTPKRYIDISDINFVLRNNFKEPLAGTNAHPFRFVWLDGCGTSKGDLCKAFGIPKEINVAGSRFVNRGLRYRAFMGWDGFHLAGWGAISTTHVQFVMDYWEGWQGNNSNNQPRSVREAHTYAATKKGTVTIPWSDAKHLVIYGYEGLQWADTLP